MFSLGFRSEFHSFSILLPLFSSCRQCRFGTEPTLNFSLEEVVGVGLLTWDLLLEEHRVQIVIRAAGLRFLLRLPSFAAGCSKNGGDQEVSGARILR